MKWCKWVTLVGMLVGGLSHATINEGLVGHWPLTPKEPLRVEWHAENADAGTWRTGSSWSAGNANVSTVTLPGGDVVWEQSGGRSLFSSALIPVDPSKTYRLTGRFRSTGSGGDSKLYFGYTPHEQNGAYISSSGTFFRGGSATISSFDDTTITAAAAVTGWSTGGSYSSQLLGFYYDGDASDGRPDYVMYSTDFGADRGKYSTTAGSTITLTSPIPTAEAAKIIPGTTVVRNHFHGSGTYLYAAASSKFPPQTVWTTYTADSTGDGWTQSGSKNFRPRTRYVRILMLLNYSQDSNYITQFDDIILEEVQGAEGSTDGSFLARDETPIRTLATADRHHGTISGPVFGDGINGEPRGAMYFDGVGDGVNMLGIPVDAGASAITIATWLRQNAGTDTYARFLSFHNGSTFHHPDLAISSSGNLEFYHAALSTGWQNTGIAIPIDTWAHIAFVFEKTGAVTLYVDGTQRYTGSFTAGNFSTLYNLMVGNRYDKNNEAIDGSIADVRVYERALSASEVAELANSGSSFVGTSKISTINSGTSAEEGRLYYNFETKKFWIGQSDGTVTQAASPPTHKTSAQISSLDGTAIDGYFYYDTESRRFYVGQPDGSLRTLTD